MKKIPSTLGKASVGAAVVAAVALGVALPSSADVGSDSPSAPVLELQQPLLRKARGAVVEVNLTFTCPAHRWYTLSFLLNQRVGPDIATGSHTQSDSCTGEEQHATFVILAEDHPFRAKASYYRSSLVMSPDYTRVDLEGEVQLVNG
ncbi:hypothetical protein ACFV4N_10705 [Actinosynnema sp. NPDC059797]